jgi:aminoglycoside phosphotransferase (APT) family kinase protein
MHSIPELVAEANAVGLVTRREVQQGLVSVRPVAPAGRVRAILVGDQPVGVVKEPGEGGGSVEMLHRERQALSRLHEMDVAPRLLADVDGTTLWARVVRGVDLVHVRAGVPELAEMCECWGLQLARLHQLPVTSGAGVSEAPRPWLLAADRRARVAARVDRHSEAAGVLATVEREPRLRLAAGQVEARWTTRHWVHGDLGPSNVVLDPAPPVRVRFLNFEHAGLGDPAWDLATALDTLVWLASRPWSQASAECLGDYFLRGYRRGGGPGSLYPAMQAVRALATAWQLAEVARDRPTGGLRGQLDGWLNRARSFADRAAARAQLAA